MIAVAVTGHVSDSSATRLLLEAAVLLRHLLSIFNQRRSPPWDSRISGTRILGSTARAPAHAARVQTVMASSVSTASTCAGSASASTPTTSASRSWTECAAGWCGVMFVLCVKTC